LIDRLFAQFTAQHADGPAGKSEWATFRSRLFEDHGI
jgi:hypothetical protein